MKTRWAMLVLTLAVLFALSACTTAELAESPAASAAISLKGSSNYTALFLAAVIAEALFVCMFIWGLVLNRTHRRTAS